MFMNGENGYFIRCTFMNALNVDYSPDFFICVFGPKTSDPCIGWTRATRHTGEAWNAP